MTNQPINPLNPASAEDALTWIMQALSDYVAMLPVSARVPTAAAANICVNALRPPAPAQVAPPGAPPERV